jgi:hypothetical protein
VTPKAFANLSSMANLDMKAQIRDECVGRHLSMSIDKSCSASDKTTSTEYVSEKG